MLKVAEKEEIICSEHDFSKEYFKILYDSETSYYYNLSPSSFKYLLYVYKIGIDFYSRKNAEYAKFLTNKLNSTFRLNLEIEFRLKLLQLKTNINKKLEQMEKPEIKASLEKKLKEESEKKIKKFKKNINSDIIMIRLELRNQRRNFIKNTRNKLFNKFINNNYLIEQNNPIDMKNKININITPIKVFNNDMIHHQLMIRTKGASDNKHCFFPTEIFFDEDINYLLKNNIGVFQKKEKNYVNNITKAFIEKYSLCYSIIIQQFIKKIIKIFDENYRNKIKLFSQYKETVSLLDEMINDEYYKKDMIKNEIGLHEENINYLKEKEELNMDLNDKLVDIVEKFEINNPIDKNAVNEIVNDYVYEILGLFV